MANTKILHVVSSMNPVLGGVSKAVESITTSLNLQNITSEVLSLDSPESDFVKNSPYKIYALEMGRKPWHYSKKLVPWLKIHGTNFTHIIVHGLWLYHSYAVNKAIRFFKKSGINDVPKYYVMPHGMLDPYFQNTKGRHLKAIRNNLYWKYIERYVINESNGLLFTCKEEKILARQPFKPYSPKGEFVVGLGVESPPIYKPEMDNAFYEACSFLGNRPFLLFLSRIHQKKGVDLLLNAYESLLKKKALKDKNIPVLVIAGPGLDSGYGKSILNQVKQSSELKNNVFFPGMLSGNTKWGAFYNCDAFVLPSHQENFGIAVVEALATNTPVLISNKVNIWREIKDADGGIIFEDNEADTYKALEKWFTLSEKERQNMALFAKEAFTNCFTIKSAVKQFIQMLYS